MDFFSTLPSSEKHFAKGEWKHNIVVAILQYSERDLLLAEL